MTYIEFLMLSKELFKHLKKLLMKKTLLALTFVFANAAFAQECKYKRNEVDEFTKNKILETKEGVFTISGMGLGFSTGFALMKVNNDRFLKLNVTSPSIFTLQNGSEIMFKVEGADPIVLNFPESIVANGVYNTSIKSTLWSGSIAIPLSEENYKRFLNEKISKLRVHTANGYVDDDVSEKRDKKFKELLKCIE